MTKKMPTVNQPRKMEAALDVLISAHAHSSTPDEYRGTTWFYFDERASLTYTSRWRLKTQEGALDRQRRETIKYLQDLRAQIDDVLTKLETREPNEDGELNVESFVYVPRNPTPIGEM